MTTHSLLYSNNPRYRVLRHIVFWLGWIAYFTFTSSWPSAMGRVDPAAFIEYSLIAMLILLSVDMVFCYGVLYFVLPQWILKERYFLSMAFIALFLLLDAALSSYFYARLINPLRKMFAMRELTEIAFIDLLRGLTGTIMITSVAVAIKLLKMWKVKQQELLLVKSEKMSWTTRFSDTFIQPSFLPIVLKRIYSYAFSASDKVPEMLEKLQNIMAYLINECNQSTVLLEHELDAIKDFIQLERLTNQGRLSIQLEQQGDAGELRIVPYVLFPFIENNFRQVNDNITDQHWASVLLQTDGSRVRAQVKNSKPVETSNLMNYETATVKQVKKRLDLLYPGSYRFNISIDEKTFTVFLELDLAKLISH